MSCLLSSSCSYRWGFCMQFSLSLSLSLLSLDALISHLTHLTHHYHHKCTDYLFVVRDPLARILSAFNYERPDMTKPIQNRYKNQFMGKEIYEECNFWTLEQLAQNGLLNTKKDERSLNVRMMMWLECIAFRPPMR